MIAAGGYPLRIRSPCPEGAAGRCTAISGGPAGSPECGSVPERCAPARKADTADRLRFSRWRRARTPSWRAFAGRRARFCQSFNDHVVMPGGFTSKPGHSYFTDAEIDNAGFSRAALRPERRRRLRICRKAVAVAGIGRCGPGAPTRCDRPFGLAVKERGPG